MAPRTRRSSPLPIDRIDATKLSAHPIELCWTGKRNDAYRMVEERSKSARREVGERQERSAFLSAQLFCAQTRARVVGGGEAVSRVRARSYVWEHACIHEAARSIYVYRRGRDGRARVPLRGKRVHARVRPRRTCASAHTRGSDRASVCVETQTKGGKPVSSGAPQRREQPFYSNPGGKRRRGQRDRM